MMKTLFDKYITGIIAIIIIVGFGCAITFAKLPDNDKNRMFDVVLLTATFYFGSSKSGANKDETIASLKGSPSVTGDKPTVNITPTPENPVQG